MIWTKKLNHNKICVSTGDIMARFDWMTFYLDEKEIELLHNKCDELNKDYWEFLTEFTNHNFSTMKFLNPHNEAIYVKAEVSNFIKSGIVR